MSTLSTWCTSVQHCLVTATERPSASFALELAEEGKQGGCLHRTTSQQQITVKINQSRRQVIKMLLVIIIVFTACWCPRYNCTSTEDIFYRKFQIFSLNFYQIFSSYRFLIHMIEWVVPTLGLEFNATQQFYYFSHIAKLLPVIHAMLNPIIYR